jgi:hypothetical protein
MAQLPYSNCYSENRGVRSGVLKGRHLFFEVEDGPGRDAKITIPHGISCWNS